MATAPILTSAWTKAKHALRELLSGIPGGRRLYRAYRYYRKKRDLVQVAPGENIFEHYYKKNYWGDEESLSGPGSTLRYTENIRRQVPRLAAELGVETFFDAPCGDYNWVRAIQWTKPIHYIGGDIVAPLIEQNRTRYGNSRVSFVHIDIVRDALPHADIWLCRDCLFHLSFRDIFLSLSNFARSDIRYLLTTVHSACDENIDIPTGSFRLLNLCKPPFNLHAPITLIDDWIEGYPVAHLALWDRERVAAWLKDNRFFAKL